MQPFSKVLFFSFLILTSCSKCDDDTIEVCPGLTGDDIPLLSQCDLPTDPIGEIFKVVEEMPAFPGCAHLTDRTERKACSEEKMELFIQENLVYPESARNYDIEGTVLMRFAVDTTGCLRNIEPITDPGCGLGLEAQRIIYEMPAWNAGRQRGNPVRVQMNIPIEFEL